MDSVSAEEEKRKDESQVCAVEQKSDRNDVEQEPFFRSSQIFERAFNRTNSSKDENQHRCVAEQLDRSATQSPKRRMPSFASVDRHLS